MDSNLYDRLSLPEAVDRYRLAERFDGVEAAGPDDPGKILVHAGDHRIEGDLLLDREGLFEDFDGLVVDGDLELTGSVVNAEGDFGPFLLVTGDLETRHLVAGGSEIRIEGDTRAKGLILGHYNHGTLRIEGRTSARLIMNDDHALEVSSDAPFWNRHGTTLGFPLSDYLHSDVPITFMDDDWDEYDERPDGVVSEHADGDWLIKRILEGQPVLTDVAEPELLKSREHWLQDVTAHGEILELVPRVHRDRDLCLAAVSDDGRALAHVPESVVDPEICLRAVEQNGYALRFVPETLRSAELLEAALREDPSAFEYLNEAEKTPERCRSVLEADGDLLPALPPELVTAELCDLAIRSASDVSGLVRHIPPDLLTEPLCLRMIEEDPYTLGYLPEDRQTVAACLAAVQANKWLLPRVPESIRDDVASQAGIDLDQLERQRAENDKLLSGPAWWMALRLFLRPAKDQTRYRGALGWLEKRPGWVVFLRFTLSLALLVAHVVLTVHVWRGEGWIAGAVTGACMILAEMYWAWRWASDGAVMVPALLAGLTAVYVVFSSFVLPKLAVTWRESGLSSDEED